jgi:hypothetical protein
VDRFSAYLLVRRFLRRPASRNQALAVEAIMQELAAHASEGSELWGLLGLLSQLDLEYAESNPRARGLTARQQAELEGLAPEHAICLERWCAPAAAAQPPPIEDALVVASLLGALALGSSSSEVPDLEEGEPEGVCPGGRRVWRGKGQTGARAPRGTGASCAPEEQESTERRRPVERATIALDDGLGERLGRELELRRQQGDPQGDRLDEALTRLRLAGGEAGRLALIGLRRAVQDFR